MRAVVMERAGGPEVLAVAEAPDPVVGPGQVAIAVAACGVPFGDVIVRSGRYAVPLPAVPGFEVAGRVAEVGDGVDPALVGRAVAATTVGNRGGYAERAVAAAEHVVAVPAGVDPVAAVVTFQAGALAAGMLAAMDVTAVTSLLVTAASGRIGSMLVQLADAAGARVVAAAGTSEKAAAAAHAHVTYADDDWVAQVRAAGGDGVEVALDGVGGTVGRGAVGALADGRGRLGIFGFAAGSWVELDTRELVTRGLTVRGALGVALAEPAERQRERAEEALAAVAAGTLHPRVAATFPLERAADAHDLLERRAAIGAVVLVP